MDVRQTIRNGYAHGVPVREIAEQTGLSQKAVSKRAVRDPECPPHGGFLNNGKIVLESSLKGNDMTRTPTQAELSAFRQHCEAHNLPFDQWRAFWHKTHDYSTFFVNQKELEADKEAFETMVEGAVKRLAQHSPKYQTVRRKKVKDPHLLVIDPADIHIRKFAHVDETGYHYNAEMATSMTIEGVEGLLQKAQGFPIERFYLVIGNDVLHTDGPMNTTTSGTRQDVHGQWWQGAEWAEEMYVTIIDRLLSIANVDVVFNPSNHDYQSGWFLTRMLKNWYRHTKNVTFDHTIRHRKYYQYGMSMIATTHGDGAKNADMPLLMAQEAAQIWADTRHRYIYQHHIHHKTATKWQAAKDYPGITLRTLRSPSAPDGWHSRNGYTGAPQAIEGFVHHPTGGQVAELSHIF